MLDQAAAENATSQAAGGQEKPAPPTAAQEASKRKKIPEGYQLWSSGIRNTTSRRMGDLEKTEILQYAAKWVILSGVMLILVVVAWIFYRQLDWWTYVATGVCLLFARDWFQRSRALNRDIQAGYVNTFEGVGDPLLKTQRGRLSIWMRFMREGWSHPLVDSGYFVTAKYEEFELLPESQALWSLEGVHLPLGTYSPSVVLSRRGTRTDVDAAFQLPAGQNKAEKEVGRRRLNDERRQQIAERMWVRIGRRELTAAEKDELADHMHAVRKLHKSLQLGLALLSFLLVAAAGIGVWLFAERFGGWSVVFDTTSMKVGLGMLILVFLMLLGSVGALNLFYTRPTLQIMEVVKRDLERGTVEFVHLPKDPEKSKEELHEVLRESGIDWTLDGHPSPWRLVGYLDLELAQLQREGKRSDTTRKILAQLADTVSSDAQEVGAGHLTFRPDGPMVKVYYSTRHVLGEDLLPPFLSMALRKVAGEVHRGVRIQAGLEVGSLKAEIYEALLAELATMLETQAFRMPAGAEIALPKTEEPAVTDKWAFYTAQPSKKIRGLIEVKEVES